MKKILLILSLIFSVTLFGQQDKAYYILDLDPINDSISKRIESLEARQLVGIRNELLQKDAIIENVSFIGEIVEVPSADALKKLCQWK